ncbi:MAG: FHA domain-containing protein [Chloroflexi bacterium]|nr:FHA domain-containing protein [Chloroflexota bacterium]
MPWYLQFEHPQLSDEPRPLEGPEVRVGRSQDNDIVLPLPEVSRHHARLFPQGDGWAIEDLNSTNGTWVNSTRLPPHKPHPLRPGDRILFSSYVIARVLSDEDVTATPTRVIPTEDAAQTELAAEPRGTEDLTALDLTREPVSPAPAPVTPPVREPSVSEPQGWAPEAAPSFWQTHSKAIAVLAAVVGFLVVFGMFLWWVDANYLWCDFFGWVPIFVCP